MKLANSISQVALVVSAITAGCAQDVPSECAFASSHCSDNLRSNQADIHGDISQITEGILSNDSDAYTELASDASANSIDIDKVSEDSGNPNEIKENEKDSSGSSNTDSNVVENDAELDASDAIEPNDTFNGTDILTSTDTQPDVASSGDSGDAIGQTDTPDVNPVDITKSPSVCDIKNPTDVCVQTLQKILCADPCLDSWIYEQAIQSDTDAAISTLEKMLNYQMGSNTFNSPTTQFETKDMKVSSYTFKTGMNGVYIWNISIIKYKADGTKQYQMSYNNNPKPSGVSGVNWPTNIAEIRFKTNANGQAESITVIKPMSCKGYSTPSNNQLTMVRSTATVSTMAGIEYQAQFAAPKCDAISDPNIDPMDISIYAGKDAMDKTCTSGTESSVYCGADPQNSGNFYGLFAGVSDTDPTKKAMYASILDTEFSKLTSLFGKYKLY